ncbi:MAG TPA: GNAT family N-acetyltransferase [Rhodocyclaceae bacterium]|nr:GNAT family N-acetyltransferase [Rhodocyclaceae bacterium]
MDIIQLTHRNSYVIATHDSDGTLLVGEDAVRRLLLKHLLKLGPEDRYLRFFNMQNDNGIGAYVERIDLTEDGVFVAFDENGKKIVGFLHALRIENLETEYEFGLTVNPDRRGQGIGYDLFATAMKWAQNLGGQRIYINCLFQNVAMQKIAEKFRMESRKIDYETKESEIRIGSAPNLLAYAAQQTANSVLLCDLAYRRQIHSLMSYFGVAH